MAQTVWWEWVAGVREIAPLPGFPLEDVTDDELRAAAERYAAPWPEDQRARVAADAIDAVTGKGRATAAYVRHTGAPPARVQARIDAAAADAAARAESETDAEERAGLIPDGDTGE